MSSDVWAVVPYRPAESSRFEAALEVRRRLDKSNVPYRFGAGALCRDDPWVKALAVVPLLALVPEGSIVVVHDADVIVEPAALDASIEAVRDGAPWAQPHRTVWRLSAEGTRELIAGNDEDPALEEHHQGADGGGIVVLRRELALDVPLDPRFVGWGQEDWSWAMALHYLAGPSVRGAAGLLHLWHPPAERDDRKQGSKANWALYRRYCKARASTEAMRELVEEARADLGLDKPTVPAAPAE